VIERIQLGLQALEEVSNQSSGSTLRSDELGRGFDVDKGNMMILSSINTFKLFYQIDFRRES
jgi:hypothetical protein